MNKAAVKEIEKFLAKVPPESRDAYIGFIKAVCLYQIESELNKEFLKKMIPLLTPPGKGKESNRKYEWDLMKGK